MQKFAKFYYIQEDFEHLNSYIVFVLVYQIYFFYELLIINKNVQFSYYQKY